MVEMVTIFIVKVYVCLEKITFQMQQSFRRPLIVLYALKNLETLSYYVPERARTNLDPLTTHFSYTT